MSKILAIIPSRHDSVRLPGKPLLDIYGKSMIERVYRSVCKANLLSHIVVATDDKRIFDKVNDFGGNAIMTSDNHRTGTSRVFEAASNFNGYDFILNIQGDQPFIAPDHIDSLCSLLSKHKDEECVVTPVLKIKNSSDIFNNSISKVILDCDKRAIFFSREGIPHIRDKDKSLWYNYGEYWKHAGIYGYTLSAVRKIKKLSVSNLEKFEKLEQLGWIYHNIPIYTVEIFGESISIDTKEDLKKAIKACKEASKGV